MCVRYQIPLWTDHSPELICIRRRTITKTSHTAHCCTEVNIKTTEVSVYGFIWANVQQKPVNSWADDNEDEKKQSHILNYGFLWSKAGTSLQRCVWMRQWSQEWWDCDVNGFTETDFIQNFRMSRGTFNYICQRLSSRLSLQDAQFRQPISLLAVCVHVWCKSRMNSDMTVQTEVALQNIRPVSDLGPHMKVAQIGIEKIRFHVICAVHTVVKTSDLSHIWAKKSDLGHFWL